ncbi:hypothetical protein V8F20_008677 [Naviculisporaceae sp. PSN 640]
MGRQIPVIWRQRPVSSTRLPVSPSSSPSVPPKLGTPILKLPEELLDDIAGLINDLPDIPYPFRRPGMSRLQIINFSMTCRRLRDASGSFLVPRVRVDFRPWSLARFEEISRLEFIRKGVRRVDVHLTAFNQDLALDFALFIRYYTRQLELYLSRKAFCLNEPSFNECQGVFASWMRIIEAGPTTAHGELTSRETEEDKTHRGFLTNAHARYKELYDEQERLLTSGEFLKRVAAAIAQMPRVKCLAFVDKLTYYQRQSAARDPSVCNAVDVLDDFYQTMQEPLDGVQTWGRSHVQRRAFLTQSNVYSVMVQLPIAIHRAGISLNELQFDLDGLQKDEILRADADTLGALSSATQSLKSIEFTCSGILNQDSNTWTGLDAPAASPDALAAYLAHLIKNPGLEEITLSPCGPCRLQRAWDPYSEESFIEPETLAKLPVSCLALSPGLPRQHLTSLTLSRVDIHCNDLLSLLASLPSKMEVLKLTEINLQGGNWEDILDVIRLKKFPDRCKRLILWYLTSKETETMDWDTYGELFLERRRWNVGALEMFCLRLRKSNPLRLFRQGKWYPQPFWGAIDEDETSETEEET